MKRSKMINKMGKTYTEWLRKNKMDKSPLNLAQIQDLMEMVLYNLEGEGMIPPDGLEWESEENK